MLYKLLYELKCYFNTLCTRTCLALSMIHVDPSPRGDMKLFLKITVLLSPCGDCNSVNLTSPRGLMLCLRAFICWRACVTGHSTCCASHPAQQFHLSWPLSLPCVLTHSPTLLSSHCSEADLLSGWVCFCECCQILCQHTEAPQGTEMGLLRAQVSICAAPGVRGRALDRCLKCGRHTDLSTSPFTELPLCLLGSPRRSRFHGTPREPRTTSKS